MLRHTGREGETVVQETTGSGSDDRGQANPTGSKVKQAHWGGPSRKKRRVDR